MGIRFGFTLALVLVAAFPAFARRPNEVIRAMGSTNRRSTGPMPTVPILRGQIRDACPLRRRSASRTPSRNPSIAPTAK